jgi:multicomponent Na+:H+ antiporter subunit D
MIFGVALASTAGYAGAIFYTAHHITIQTTLFLVLGLVEIRAGSTSLSRLGGLAALSPVLGILFFVPAMNLAGIPPFSGFIGKVGLLEAGVQHGGVLAYVLVGGGVVTSLLTLYAMAKVWNRAFWRPLRTAADEAGLSPAESAGQSAGDAQDDDADDLPQGRRLPWPMVATTVVLVLLGVGLTVVAGPLYGYAQRSAADLVGQTAYVRAVLPGGTR